MSTFKIEYLKDSIGNNYVGINMFTYITSPYIDALSEILSKEDFKLFTDNQKIRDNNKYHITLFNVIELNQICSDPKKLKYLVDYVINLNIPNINLKGIGEASRGLNKCYFIIIESDLLDKIRRDFGFEKKDLHITIGFNPKDVHGVDKSKVINKIEKFIKLFKNEFYIDPSLSFLKHISNWNQNLKGDIKTFSLTDKHIDVYCDNYYITIGCIDNELTVLCEWIDKSKSVGPFLTQTEILKIIKEKYE